MVLILLLRKDWIGMSNIRPKGKNTKPVYMPFGRHLVYSEGTKTEKKYVENLKKSIARKYAR